MVPFALRLNVYWMGKTQLFKPPFRGIMMADMAAIKAFYAPFKGKNADPFEAE